MATVTVETAHSTYIFDLNAQVFTRLPAHADASRLDGDGVSQAYEWRSDVIVGQPMMIGLHNGKTRVSTSVTGVTRSE